MVIKWSYHLKRKMPQIVSTPTSSSGGYCDCGPEDACENVSIGIKKGLIRVLFIYKYIVVVIMILLSKAS
jgi:hypothetical protein